jgi:plasmid stabilization system protein ParE
LGYKVLYSDAALTGLEKVVEFIHKDNPEAASRFGKALLNHVDLLATFPHIGAPVHRKPGIREILHTPIRIYYRIHEDRKTVEVLQFWHASRRRPRFPT